MATNTATKIRQLESFTGDAALYQLTPPMNCGDGEEQVSHVVVSATVVPYSGPETYIFRSDENGKVENWGELEGSFRGGLSHSEALSGAGYEIAG